MNLNDYDSCALKKMPLSAINYVEINKVLSALNDDIYEQKTKLTELSNSLTTNLNSAVDNSNNANLENYYTKSETNELTSQLNNNLSGYYTKSQSDGAYAILSNSLKQELSLTNFITVITQAQYDQLSSDDMLDDDMFYFISGE